MEYNDTMKAELDAMVSMTMSEFGEAGAKVVYCEHNELGVTFAAVLGESGTVWRFSVRAEPSTTSTKGVKRSKTE